MLMNRPAAAHAEAIPDDIRADVETLWRYHDMHHELRPCDVGIGLGSHDLGVAVIATRLFHEGLFPWIVFTGANAPTTVERFPRGEAVHYREYAIEQGVPAEALLVEPRATNTAENLEYSRELLAERHIPVQSVLIMSRPYQQRRAYATCKLVWPEVDVVCASNRLELNDYVRSTGEPRRVVDMLVGDTQRIEVYAERGFAIPQEMPDEVRAAFGRLVAAGYTSRLI
ncbi:YdcF family protein [Micromonospora psammae]|uniref:YdcF family protein n=1 Tax=Micromonospora sp. CPCC 205556 TaxID=3122398 RepID=UPI002FEEF5D5